MLKALLVDDEINILRNLQSVIPWENIGIEIVGTAENGAKALELVDRLRPDLVVSDISMPIMDGITFVQKLRERGIPSECVMLTGYQSFEYARSLMRYGVKEYMMKPVDYDELERVIRRTAASILEKELKAKQEQRVRNSAVNLVYEKNLHDLLLDCSSVDIHLTLDEEGKKLDLDRAKYLLLLVDLEHYAQLSLGWDEKERKLWNFAIYNVLSEVLCSENRNYTVLQMREGEWCLLIEQAGDKLADEDINRAGSWAELIRESVRSSIKLDVHVSIYVEWIPISGLGNAYKRVHWESSLSPASVTYVAAAQGQGAAQIQLDMLWKLTEDMVTGLKQCSRMKTEEAMQALNTHLKIIPDSSLLRVRQIIHYFVLNLIREMREVNMLTQSEEDAIWVKLNQCIRVKDVLLVMNEMVSQCLVVFVSKKTSVVLMESAQAYIHEHMSKDIGIDELASTLGISNSYFSLLFKQHFGVTFVEYLTKLRMETAKAMLETKERRVAQVSKSVGYLDGRYFMKLFHRYTGMTPTEYRTSRRN
ncbi:response regulator [Paenibacillus alba]|uniref:response regulator transcription factor n=1 Tax=Paenibacillus alba TaxID=1197127 RepID=UPI0015631342|nr:response regulator [Paenibacillus alba]NQX71306.1 response regulator [Paenibacillus alba]